MMTDEAKAYRQRLRDLSQFGEQKVLAAAHRKKIPFLPKVRADGEGIPIDDETLTKFQEQQERMRERLKERGITLDGMWRFTSIC